MAWSIHFLPPSPPSIHPSFHLANLKLCTFEMVISHPSSQPLGNHCAFRLYDFNYSSTSFQWIQCIFLVCLLLAHCSQHNVSKVLSYVVYIRITFLSKANIALYVCTTFCLPIYLSVDCNLGCFYLWLLWEMLLGTWVYKSPFRFLILNISLRTVFGSPSTRGESVVCVLIKSIAEPSGPWTH